MKPQGRASATLPASRSCVYLCFGGIAMPHCPAIKGEWRLRRAGGCRHWESLSFTAAWLPLGLLNGQTSSWNPRSGPAAELGIETERPNHACKKCAECQA